MLTVEFKENGIPLLTLHAHNRGPAFPRTGLPEHKHLRAYAWAIERAPRLEVEPARLSGRLVHDRRDGAIELARKVLEQAGMPASDPS